MKLSQIRQVLSETNIQLTKSLGQNLLHDANQLQRIIAAAELRPTDRVLEIGPGLGPLTELLVAKSGEVLAIEKDARLIEFLRQRFNLPEDSAPPPNPTGSGQGAVPPDATGCSGLMGGRAAVFHLIHDDALEFLRRERRDWSEWKLVANLPYSVASPILVELAQSERGPQRMVVTLQLEVARRLMAQPGQKDYGVLTLLVQLEYQPLHWFKIPTSCFFPEPEVDSACVSLHRRSEFQLSPAQRALFARIVKRSFSQRRKMMLKRLKTEWPDAELDRAFTETGISPQARAETLSVEHFVRLTKCLPTG
ncbi:MAG TPA: rRNA adenine dimethyltransferase family protein [Verrucomicrobiae bacterium]|nr:rRNA adenine dimethyltransferase family protein [Verrucomicrobiae bacterium]